MNIEKLKAGLIRSAKKAQDASRFLLSLSQEKKNDVLRGMSEALLAKKEYILKANDKDVKKAASLGNTDAFIDRLRLDQKRIGEMAEALLELTRLHDPVGEVIREWYRPNGLKIRKVRTPIGVIAIIYESRPNVTSDCIGLCFKSGNSVILRGGSEALNSNSAIFKVLKTVIKKHGIPEGAINLVSVSDRKAVGELLKLNDYIDLVMPRGGEGLIKLVMKCSRIPVIKHYKGICHVYVDEWADLNIAQKVCFNAKVQRPGTCNAMETMLVHKEAAVRFLPWMLKQFEGAGVQIRGCALTRKIGKAFSIKKAEDKDYRREYLDLILSVKVVESLEQAIKHINEYGSRHSDSIITEDEKSAALFLKQVDSACVYVNASTRFTDGYQFGLGSEIGISTDKLHARGPMGLEELTTYKYMVFGNGQVRT
ncbi:MAG: glutamate-5-semialdehyde dehydrogenase [Candidatus Omnitrophica bacterium]|nr:glutamate-5-semialdehyde dehydrogenase [Candidatus Omnitrophota bacterium]